jgi:hypothetical protein
MSFFEIGLIVVLPEAGFDSGTGKDTGQQACATQKNFHW